VSPGTVLPETASVLRVVFIDRAWPVVAQIIRKFAESVRGTHIRIIFISDKEPSSVDGNLEVINIFDVPQRHSLSDLQTRYAFSLHKTLVPERAFFDYSSFRSSQCYSRLTHEQIEARITPYANAFDYVIREKADFVMEWYPDCFIPAMAGQIARHYGKPFRMVFAYYWWNNGALFIDREDLTSSDIDTHYQFYYAHPELCDRAQLDAHFNSKKCSFVFTSAEMYTFSMRVRQALNRFKSYEPPSVRNWIVRKVSRAWSSVMIRAGIQRLQAARDEPFVLFPLHVSPEASLLGTFPELAEQFALIKNLSLNLPYGVKLYVKEHPGSEFGLGLDYGFYRRLSVLPNVRIIRADARLDQLLDHPRFLAVAVINGTVGLDAARKRKPVFLFGRALYGAADCFMKPATFTEFYRQLNVIIRGEFRFDDNALYAMLKALDASIVRADVDFLACRTAAEVLLTYPAIWRRYLDSGAWTQAEPPRAMIKARHHG
jgi:Capsule polysaccharide biosynthesis protein